MFLHVSLRHSVKVLCVICNCILHQDEGAIVLLVHVRVPLLHQVEVSGCHISNLVHCYDWLQLLDAFWPNILPLKHKLFDIILVLEQIVFND